jgi:hypothetical protein
MEKRHPDWKPAPIKEQYTLNVRLVDGGSDRPLAKREVEVHRWNAKVGGLSLDVRLRTDGNGWTSPTPRASGELEACIARLPGYRVAARCFRPLAGQNLRLHLRAWPLRATLTRYVWRKGDDVNRIAELCGQPVEALLKVNGLAATGFKAGLRVVLPCWAASIRPEGRETWDSVAASFGYGNARGLAKALGMKSLDAAEEVVLPDWNLFYAREGDRLTDLDAMFGLAKGSVRTVGRVHHPDPDRPYVGETVAVPLPEFTIKVIGERPARSPQPAASKAPVRGTTAARKGRTRSRPRR